MIDAVRSWLTSIAAVTLMLTVVQTLVPEGTQRKISGFTGGAFAAGGAAPAGAENRPGTAAAGLLRLRGGH